MKTSERTGEVVLNVVAATADVRRVREALSRLAVPTDVVDDVRNARGRYLVFVPERFTVDGLQLGQQVRYLESHPSRSFQNWLGEPDSTGVPDEDRYRAAESLIAALYYRGHYPPPSVMLRRALLNSSRTIEAAASSTSTHGSVADLQLHLSACLSYPLLGPEYVQIGPIDACNARCLFCVHHSPLVDHDGHSYKSMLPWDVWKNCLDDVMAMKTRRVDYIGIGEPLMHPRIADALAYGSRHLTQNMISNGLLLKRHIRTVADHLDWLTVSLNAATAATQHALHLTGEQGFTTTVDAIRELVSVTGRRTQVSVSFVVNKENFREIPLLPRLCQDLGVHAGLTPIGIYEGMEAKLGFTADEQRELADIIEQVGAMPDHRILNLEQFRQFENRDTSYIVQQIPCYVGLVFAQIRGDGSVSHCCACEHEPVGNVNQQRFADIWISEEYRRFRRDALFTIVKTQQSLKGCHCDICGFAFESIRVHNRLHRTAHTPASLKASAPARSPMRAPGVPVTFHKQAPPADTARVHP